MKTKRYFKLVLKPYNIILKHFDKDIKLSIGQKFCCFPQLEEPEIEIPIVENKLGRQTFHRKMERRLKENKIEGQYTTEILSLLHEIGHIYTYKKINDITYRIGTTIIQELQAKFTNPKYLDFFYNWYFNLKLERLADKWVVKFIRENAELVNQWQEMLNKNYAKVLPKLNEHFITKYKTDLLAE